MRLYWSVAGRARLRTNLTGMRVTLEKMKAILEGLKAVEGETADP
jgi:hypothetical protein